MQSTLFARTRQTLEDTQTTEIGERDLEFPHSLGSRDEVLDIAGSPCKNELA